MTPERLPTATLRSANTKSDRNPGNDEEVDFPQSRNRESDGERGPNDVDKRREPFGEDDHVHPNCRTRRNRSGVEALLRQCSGMTPELGGCALRGYGHPMTRIPGATALSVVLYAPFVAVCVLLAQVLLGAWWIGVLAVAVWVVAMFVLSLVARRRGWKGQRWLDALAKGLGANSGGWRR